MRQRICGIHDGGLDIVLGQMRVGLEQVGGRGAFAEFSKDQLHHDARAAVTGLPSITFGLISIRSCADMSFAPCAAPRRVARSGSVANCLASGELPFLTM